MQATLHYRVEGYISWVERNFLVLWSKFQGKTPSNRLRESNFIVAYKSLLLGKHECKNHVFRDLTSLKNLFSSKHQCNYAIFNWFSTRLTAKNLSWRWTGFIQSMGERLRDWQAKHLGKRLPCDRQTTPSKNMGERLREWGKNFKLGKWRCKYRVNQRFGAEVAWVRQKLQIGQMEMQIQG